MAIIPDEQLINVDEGEWLYKPKPKETQIEFQQNVFKKYEGVFAFLLLFVLAVACVLLWQNGIIDTFLDLFKNV